MSIIRIPADTITQSVSATPTSGEVNIVVKETGKVSDGYHTFDELYDHRITLFIALCRIVATMPIAVLSAVYDYKKLTAYVNRPLDQRNPFHPWRSKLHHDGTSWDGWFIMGMGKENGKQISYHIPLSRWDETAFAETLDRAPEWDGHTPDDVIQRLKKI